MTGQLQATTLTDGTLIITNGDLTTIGDVSCKDVIVSGSVDGIDVAGMSAFVVLNSAHRNDNTQAHTDYLINNGDDTTTGKLTMAGFGLTADGDANNQDIENVKTLTMNGEIDDGNSSTADTIAWTSGNFHKKHFNWRLYLYFYSTCWFLYSCIKNLFKMGLVVGKLLGQELYYGKEELVLL